MRYKYIINPKYERLFRFIKEVPDKFDVGGTLIYDSRNKVRIFTVEGMKVVVKRFRIPYFHQRFDYTFVRPSKAKRAYTYGLRLLELGICTPEPIACVEEYSFGLFRQGYLLSAFCGDKDTRIIRSEPDGHDDLIDALAHFLVDMHQKGFLHGDTNLSNFLYRKDDASPTGYHITTIDINRSCFVKKPIREACLRSLVRLTHVRAALRKIVRRYAELRNWNADEAVDFVVGKLDDFEKRQRLKHRMKHKSKR
ncbi:MAG: lipopolysaccharide kinase InaA family protein [Bacteroidaceae bacterium]|nr:lipopolysaccharide kinase InaA family protein [Bacteroidaceae bacterium]